MRSSIYIYWIPEHWGWNLLPHKSQIIQWSFPSPSQDPHNLCISNHHHLKIPHLCLCFSCFYSFSSFFLSFFYIFSFATTWRFVFLTTFVFISHDMIQSYNERKLKQGVKKYKFSYFSYFFLPTPKKKETSFSLFFFLFLPPIRLLCKRRVNDC